MGACGSCVNGAAAHEHAYSNGAAAHEHTPRVAVASDPYAPPEGVLLQSAVHSAVQSAEAEALRAGSAGLAHLLTASSTRRAHGAHGEGHGGPVREAAAGDQSQAMGTSSGPPVPSGGAELTAQITAQPTPLHAIFEQQYAWLIGAARQTAWWQSTVARLEALPQAVPRLRSKPLECGSPSGDGACGSSAPPSFPSAQAGVTPLPTRSNHEDPQGAALLTSPEQTLRLCQPVVEALLQATQRDPELRALWREMVPALAERGVHVNQLLAQLEKAMEPHQLP